jgi:hypothetical protein
MVTFVIKEKILIKSTINSTIISNIKQTREKAKIGPTYIILYAIKIHIMLSHFLYTFSKIPFGKVKVILDNLHSYAHRS